ncbi:MAG: hypothetical protein CMI67_13115 [Pelagibaca sp.]|nr:hypothetical protein [Pelagibaca sp.]
MLGLERGEQSKLSLMMTIDQTHETKLVFKRLSSFGAVAKLRWSRMSCGTQGPVLSFRQLIGTPFFSCSL